MPCCRCARRVRQGVTAVGEAGAPLESYVLCLLAEDLPRKSWRPWSRACRWSRAMPPPCTATTVAMGDRMTAVAAAAAAQGTPAGQEVAAFLEWAKNEGFEPFGYAYYVVEAGQPNWRDIPSRIGVLQDTAPGLRHLPGEHPGRPRNPGKPRRNACRSSRPTSKARCTATSRSTSSACATPTPRATSSANTASSACSPAPPPRPRWRACRSRAAAWPRC
jgi:hypothetical protein